MLRFLHEFAIRSLLYRATDIPSPHSRIKKISTALEFLSFSACIITWMYFCKGKLSVLQ